MTAGSTDQFAQDADRRMALAGEWDDLVEQVRSLPHRSLPDAGAAVFLLDPPAVRTQDLQALRTFVRGCRCIERAREGGSEGRRIEPREEALERGLARGRAGREAQRGARISKTGCLGGTNPSGRFGRKVAQGSFSSSAQRRFLWK